MSNSTTEVNLDKWRWLREVSGLSTETIADYKELERKNEALVVPIFGKDAFNIDLPEKRQHE